MFDSISANVALATLFPLFVCLQLSIGDPERLGTVNS